MRLGVGLSFKSQPMLQFFLRDVIFGQIHFAHHIKVVLFRRGHGPNNSPEAEGALGVHTW